MMFDLSPAALVVFLSASGATSMPGPCAIRPEIEFALFNAGHRYSGLRPRQLRGVARGQSARYRRARSPRRARSRPLASRIPGGPNTTARGAARAYRHSAMSSEARCEPPPHVARQPWARPNASSSEICAAELRHASSALAIRNAAGSPVSARSRTAEAMSVIGSIAAASHAARQSSSLRQHVGTEKASFYPINHPFRCLDPRSENAALRGFGSGGCSRDPVTFGNPQPSFRDPWLTHEPMTR